MNILIIAGHGGTPYDPGAVGSGYSEAPLTRELATLLQKELIKIKGVNPVMYDQSKDAYSVLSNSGSIPLAGIDYVLEIHFNAGASDTNGDGFVTGTEVLVHSSENGDTVEQQICKRVSGLGFTNRGVKRRSDLYVMNYVKKQNGISHALLEVCFIDDIDDMRLYTKSKLQTAQAIAKGVAEGFGLEYEEDDVMTKAEVQEIAGAEVQKALKEIEDGNPRYTKVSQVPAYWQKEVNELIKLGVIAGDGKSEINIRHDSLQSVVIAMRIMKAKTKS